ncbi:hypothetical protein ACLESO_28225 [Pyxidicoccus sp. 3LG]
MDIVAKDPTAGLDWDVDGSAPDVVVRVVCPTDGEPVPYSTPETSSFSPRWSGGGCDTTSDVLLRKPVQFEILDVDVAFDDEIAVGSFQLTEESFETGGVTLPVSGEAGTLSIRLVRGG